MFVQAYSFLKSGWSRLNDALMGGAPRRPIPTFPAPEAVAEYLMTRCVYVPDPLSGAFDWSVHPERLQAAMERGHDAIRAIPGVDCDDWAAYAHAALLKIPECQPQIMTLWDASGRFGHHVVCVYRWRLRYGVIDTNGHASLPNIDPAAICRHFSQVYASQGYRYDAAVHTNPTF